MGWGAAALPNGLVGWKRFFCRPSKQHLSDRDRFRPGKNKQTTACFFRVVFCASDPAAALFVTMVSSVVEDI